MSLFKLWRSIVSTNNDFPLPLIVWICLFAFVCFAGVAKDMHVFAKPYINPYPIRPPPSSYVPPPPPPPGPITIYDPFTGEPHTFDPNKPAPTPAPSPTPDDPPPDDPPPDDPDDGGDDDGGGDDGGGECIPADPYDPRREMKESPC